jgi:hypothetical protein
MACSSPGAVSQNMKLALRKTYDAIPAPKIVIAVGACAIGGGPFVGHAEVNDGGTDLLPIDLLIAGCPPTPHDPGRHPPAPRAIGRWSLRDLLAHFAAHEQKALAEITATWRGERLMIDPGGTSEFNARGRVRVGIVAAGRSARRPGIGHAAAWYGSRKGSRRRTSLLAVPLSKPWAIPWTER